MPFRLFGVTFLALMAFLLIYWPTYQAWAGHHDPDESSLPMDILLSVMQDQNTFFPAHEPADQFGHSVSVDGDVAIVGIPSYSNLLPAFSRGMAQIYRFDGRKWRREQLLHASDGVLGDRFGSAVSIRGDVAIVGARFNSVYLFRWDGNQWQQEQKLEGSNKSVNFGFRVDISADRVFIAARGAVYVYRFADSSWQLEQTLSASDENESSFGYSLSASGNYLLVGAPEEDTDHEQGGSGVAYVYRFDGSSWIEESKLMASNAAEVYDFGTSVSLSDDKALIRAAPFAYIWRRHQNGEQWQEEARFAINNVFSFIEFPYHKSVAIDGNRAVIQRDDRFLAILHWNGSRWVEEKRPFLVDRVGDKQPKGYFSSAPPLSLSGSRLLVGDPWLYGTGSAYLFDLSVKRPDITMSHSDLSLALVEGTTRSERLTITNNTTETMTLQCTASCQANNWLNMTPISSTLPPMASQELLIHMDATTLKREDYNHLLTMTSDKADFTPINLPVSLSVIPPERTLSGSDLTADNQFGQAVSIHGDLALVGVTPDSSNSQEPGSAYLYRWNGSNWQEETRLTASDGTAGNGFGRAVALSDSVAVVSAPFREKNGSDLGTVYVYRKNGDTWQESIVTGRGDEFYFGISVSISGDLLLVGTPFANTNNHQSGAVYVFRWNGESWQQESRLFLSNGSRFGYFGSSVSVSGDGNGDGNVALIAASGESQGDSNGLAYIYRWDGSNWRQEQTLQPSAGGDFGGTVSLSGDVALIGHHTGGPQKQGAGYFFRFNGQNWVEETAFNGQKWHHEFGYSVSVDGNLAIIGARSDDEFNSDSGAAYVYRWDGTNWQEQYKIGATNGAEFDHFGTSIALSGENALIGAPFNNQHGDNSGAAYLYDLSAASAIWLPIVIK